MTNTVMPQVRCSDCNSSMKLIACLPQRPHAPDVRDLTYRCEECRKLISVLSERLDILSEPLASPPVALNIEPSGQ